MCEVDGPRDQPVSHPICSKCGVRYERAERVYPTIETFLKTRIVEEIEGARNLSFYPIVHLLDVWMEIVEWHENWPVLVTGEMETTSITPDFVTTPGLDPSNSIFMRVAQEMEWMTNKEYIRRFGEAPPTAPLLMIMARRYQDHDDFDPRWAE